MKIKELLESGVRHYTTHSTWEAHATQHHGATIHKINDDVYVAKKNGQKIGFFIKSEKHGDLPETRD